MSIRKRVARRNRKEILRSGGEIKFEGWDDGYKKKRDDRCYRVNVAYLGWNICSLSEDYYEAYRMALECVRYTEEPWIENITE